MPEPFGAVLAIDGLLWLFAAAFVAGLVRGFSGFGSGLIYMPVAAQVLPPVWAVITVTVMDFFGVLPNVPSAFRVADRRDLGRLAAGAVLALPVGLGVLAVLEPAVFRTAVSLLALTMLALLLAGVRYRGTLGPKLTFGTGVFSGFLGGSSGLPGPPVIMLYMASSNSAPVVRASIMAYLFCYDFLLVVVLAIKSALTVVPVLIGIVMVLPNAVGNMAGAAIFRPSLERVYRTVAYVIIAVSAISALPVWG